MFQKSCMRIENHNLALSDAEYQRLFRPSTSTVNVYIDVAVIKHLKDYLSLLRRYYPVS
jgi:hypothetical protein